jgi:predicted metalloprotease with PDZ domain
MPIPSSSSVSLFLAATKFSAMTLVAASTLWLTPALLAQGPTLPQPAPVPPPIAAPADTPYPGKVELMVDLTDNARRIVGVHETIPVEGSELTLLYPQWIPGHHSPVGPISKLGGIVVTAQGKRIQWVRDRVNVYAFHILVPEGVKSVDVDFQYLSPIRPTEGRIEISNEIADLAWSEALMYPAGHFSRDITFSTTLKLPEGWKYATALETASGKGNVVHFKDTPLNTLVDSPLYAGSHFKRVDLSTGPDNIVRLDVFADTEDDLAITPEELEVHKRLTQEAQKLYASHHYDHYDFLLLLSDKVGGVGLEHHQSSEDGHPANYFTMWADGMRGRDLLGHEYTHSWDGKFRRPADLWTPNFNVPMQDDLLWVYEGMTQYWGNVLTARSGMRSASDARDLLAMVAANFDISPGRTWRPMVDTTNQPTISQRSPVSWVSWQRPEDYYSEGMLIWLDADTKIRELSGDRKSLDDFAKLFFGVENGSYITKTYTFDDVVTALNTVQPYDWAQFLHERVDELAPKTPEDGFARGGYRLVYNDTPADWVKRDEDKDDAVADFSRSLGFNTYADGTLINVWWDSAAFKAGVTPDMRLQAVNGQVFTAKLLRAAIVRAEKNKSPLQLLFKRGDQFQTIAVDYHGGLRYVHLERVAGTPDRLDAILAPGGGPSVVQ